MSKISLLFPSIRLIRTQHPSHWGYRHDCELISLGLGGGGEEGMRGGGKNEAFKQGKNGVKG